MDAFLEALDATNRLNADYSLQSTILTLLMAFVLGQAIAWTYAWTHSGLSYSRSYTQSLVLMTIVVSLVMLVIGDSIVTAFGLLGALALDPLRQCGKEVGAIAPDRKNMRTLEIVKTPADIGLDRKRSLLYVPQFEHKRVVVYKLQKK